jgi:hypothetical protein
MSTPPTRRTPYEIYKELELGPGGYAIVPSTETRRGVREAICRKLGRRDRQPEAGEILG